MSRPIPPKPAFIVKGNEGHMPRLGMWKYDAFHVNESTFVSATVEYRIDVTDRRPESISAVVWDAEFILHETWGPDGQLIDVSDVIRFICHTAVLEWFWAHDVHKVTKLELEALKQ